MTALFRSLSTVMMLGIATFVSGQYIQDPSSNQTTTNLPTEGVHHRVYMIGDAGGLDDKEARKNYVFEAAHRRINADAAEKSIVYLGDNIYNAGLQEETAPSRKLEENIIQAHLDLVKGNNAKMYILPGNHDWNNNKAGGLAAIKRQENYIKDHRIDKKRVKFYPKNGCGDPEVVKISKDLVYVIFDSQWWVHDWSSEDKINEGCKVKSRREFIDLMKDIIIEHKNDQILFFLHHPMVSNGNHGGNFSAKDHLFPLSKINKNLLVPMPFLGSIYPMYRQLGGSNQDNTYKLIKELHKSMESVVRGYDAAQTMFISGHDHLLQHSVEQFIFQKSPIHYVISGSGYKKDYVANGLGASFAHSERGYSVLHIYEDGSTWLDFYTVTDSGNKETLAYRTQIYAAKPSKQEFTRRKIDTADSENESITLAPNNKFGKGGIFRFFLGDQYREAWTTPIKSPIFGLDKYYGGLTPTKKGGGLFTRTLRLENEEGHEFVMRSMNKDFYKAVPRGLQHLELLKLYADQNTASIPYGALYISSLSEYAGVYHADPKVVYLDKPSELGPFEQYFPKGHYLLEARPDGDWSKKELFGSSQEIVGYNDLLYTLRKKTTHFVDQKWVLKSRLFDIFIHDRDRHDDQWRWASFEEGDKTIYRPVPRDRDWAFFKYGGVIPWVMGNIVDKKLKSFKANGIDVKSLATNANNFDRYFLNELTWDEWEAVIDEFVNNMTDEAIEGSIAALPEESQPYLTEEIVPKLKSRREILKRDVKKYYDFITKEVEITGSDEEDIFEISRLESGDTHVIVYKDSKKHGKVERYNRVLTASETKEIRIYGLAGDDQFNISVAGKNHSKMRLIGGIDEDVVTLATADGKSTNILVYDDPDGMQVSDLSLVKDRRSTDLITNKYDRRGFLYDTGLPWLNLGYAPDDGLVLGVGFNTIKHGWRKSPYEASHLFNLEVTPGERFSIDVEYEGEYPDLFRKGLGFAPSFFIEIPDNINFFDLGAAENNDHRDSDYNWVQLSSYGVNTHFIHRAAGSGIRLRFGPSYESYKVDDEDDRLNIVADSGDFTEEDFERSHFIGLSADIRLHTLDRFDKPSRGMLVRAEVKQQYELGASNHTVKLGANVAWFTPISVRYDIVFGSNTGYQKIFGDARFYQYPAMGNKAYLRPFRNERYRGEAIAYQQFDLRFRLVTWNNSVLPVTIGGIGGYDFGQNFYAGEDTGPIKHGWTGGLSFDLVNYFVLRTSFSGSDEGTYFKFDVGYAF